MDQSQMQPMQPPVASSVMQPAAAPEGQQMVTEQEKQQLLDIIAKIKSKLADLNAVRFASRDKNEKVRRDILKQVFEKLQLAGVDLSDKRSVADFIARIRANNPELADMFEQSMNVLLGGPTPDQVMPQENNMNNINQNETLPQNIQEPLQ